MTGLEKIIDRILEEAKETARGTLERAQADCRAMAEQYATRADEIRDNVAQKAEQEGKSTIVRARSAAAMNRRNILLSSRSALIDEAFETARQQVRETDFGKYRELLIAMLTCALIDEAESEKKSIELGDEVAQFDTFEVLFNQADRETYGQAVVEAARRNVARKIGAERAAKIRLSEEIADIDGGLILRYGNIEANCSLSMLISEMRNTLEEKVSATLFD